MLMRVRRIGSGTPDDPFRAPFPRYSTVESSIFGWMVVDVHVSSLPEGFAEPGPGEGEDSDRGRVRTRIDQRELMNLHAHFDNVYQEHRGEFRPELR